MSDYKNFEKIFDNIPSHLNKSSKLYLLEKLFVFEKEAMLFTCIDENNCFFLVLNVGLGFDPTFLIKKINFATSEFLKAGILTVTEAFRKDDGNIIVAFNNGDNDMVYTLKSWTELENESLLPSENYFLVSEYNGPLCIDNKNLFRMID